MLTLSNGTVVQQMVSPLSFVLVCIKLIKLLIQTDDVSILDDHQDVLKRGIAKRFVDGNGLLTIKYVFIS